MEGKKQNKTNRRYQRKMKGWGERNGGEWKGRKKRPPCGMRGNRFFSFPRQKEANSARVMKCNWKRTKQLALGNGFQGREFSLDCLKINDRTEEEVEGEQKNGRKYQIWGLKVCLCVGASFVIAPPSFSYLIERFDRWLWINEFTECTWSPENWFDFNCYRTWRLRRITMATWRKGWSESCWWCCIFIKHFCWCMGAGSITALPSFSID